MRSTVHETRFSPLTRIVRRRLLPAPGEVRVRVGDRVQADEIVAETRIEGQVRMIDLAADLQLSRRAVARHLRVEPGQTVALGAALAVAGLPGRRRMAAAPVAGTVVGVHDGTLLIRQDPQQVLLQAYVPGEVVESYPHRGVDILTAGALVRGVWGCGGETQGVLAVMVDAPDGPLTWDRVGLRYKGAIVAGGVLDDPRTLQRAAQFALGGLVVGSLAPALRPLCAAMGLPVVVTEGIGRIAMAQPIFDLLRLHHGHLSSLSGAGPELVVPLAGGAQAVGYDTGVDRPRRPEPGMRVRLVRPPYLGLVAEIVAADTLAPDDAAAAWAQGTAAEGADVRLPDGAVLFVPYVNMEPLE